MSDRFVTDGLAAPLGVSTEVTHVTPPICCKPRTQAPPLGRLTVAWLLDCESMKLASQAEPGYITTHTYALRITLNSTRPELPASASLISLSTGRPLIEVYASTTVAPLGETIRIGTAMLLEP